MKVENGGGKKGQKSGRPAKRQFRVNVGPNAEKYMRIVDGESLVRIGIMVQISDRLYEQAIDLKLEDRSLTPHEVKKRNQDNHLFNKITRQRVRRRENKDGELVPSGYAFLGNRPSRENPGKAEFGNICPAYLYNNICDAGFKIEDIYVSQGVENGKKFLHLSFIDTTRTDVGEYMVASNEARNFIFEMLCIGYRCFYMFINPLDPEKGEHTGDYSIQVNGTYPNPDEKSIRYVHLKRDGDDVFIDFDGTGLWSRDPIKYPTKFFDYWAMLNMKKGEPHSRQHKHPTFRKR